MKINNSLLVEKINQAIISYNKDSKDEEISLIKNEEIPNEDLIKIENLYIDISDIPKEEKNAFFEELGNTLGNMQLKGLYLYSRSDDEPIEIDMSFLSKLNERLEVLQISGINLTNINTNIFSHLKKLHVLILGNNNINNLEFISQIDENVAIDLGNNPMDNANLNEIIMEVKKRNGKMAFNEHPFYNAITFAINDKKVNLGNFKIPESMIDEIIHFFNEYEIHVTARPEDLKKMNEREEKLKYPNGFILNGTKDITTKFLESHPDILEIEIRDEENDKFAQPFYSYTREDFLQIRRKIDEIKQQIEIPNDFDNDREKKIFMQVYQILGQMIEYNYYAISDEGKKDYELETTCRNLKDGLLKGKAVCAGYANILKNVLGEFGIKSMYISADLDELHEDYDEKDPSRSCVE